MKKLKILFVGVGSIARRHIDNLRTVLQQSEYVYQIDAFRTGLGSEIHPNIYKCFCDYEETPTDYDIIFITNPTELHMETLKRFHNNGKHFFIEKPICTLEQLKKTIDFSLRNESVYYVASPLRYTKVIQYIKNNINTESVLAIRSISSSYLPDWRPGSDYRKTYSAQKALGGGVAIDLIHEWDYLTYLFGMPKTVKTIYGKMSDLEIDTEDIAIYIAEYDSKVVELHLDYFGRIPIRKLELFTSDDTIECDLIRSRINFMKSGKCIEFGEERNDYQIMEIRHFISLVEEGKYENKVLEAMKILDCACGGIV